MYNRLLTICIFIIFGASISVASANTLRIEGTGDSQELLRVLAKKFEELNPDIKVVVPKSVGSGGGVKKVINEQSLLGRTSRALTDNEKAAGVKEIVFAYSPVVFAINTDITDINLSTKNIVDIFSGKIKKYDQLENLNLKGKIYTIRRESGDSSLSMIENNMPQFKAIDKYAGKIAYSNQEAVKLVKRYKNTIAYLPLPNIIDTTLKIVTLDNIKLSKETILNKSYKLVTPLALVYKDKLQNISKKFIEFLKTKEANEIMQKNGVVSNF